MVVTAPALRRLDPVAAGVLATDRAAPGASVAASRRGVGGVGHAGSLSYEEGAPSVEDATPFDLASVTKPFVALALARLERAGVLSRQERLGDVIPSLADTPTGRVPLDSIAAHRAGLEAHQRLFAPLLEGGSVEPAAAYRAAASARRADCAGEPPPDGFAPVYSDMGYLLLGLALETRCGAPLDEVVRAHVTAPLGIEARVGSAAQLRAAGRSFDERVAPTEDVTFRGGVVAGAVHDENAWAITGAGLAGHAGLFGDAEAVLRLGLELLAVLDGRSSFLDARELDPLVRARPGGSLRAGFDGRTDGSPSSGARLGPRTFGHLGFTGTSLWIDPDAAFVGVLLTNRVHPTRDHIAIRAARPAAYDAMFDALS